MCGISGYFGKKVLEQDTLKKTLELMKYRGPDFQAFRTYNCKNNVLHFLHSRLSIIDLETRSNQPLENNNNVIIFNGEIYNYLEIKKKLLTKGFKFKTNSDTEVILKAYEFYGTSCVNYFEGMWSFAIFDKLKNIIFISRDRFGEKPLFYINKNQNFYFGSEIKFIKSLIQKKLNINYDLVNDFLNYGYKSLKKKKEFFYNDIKELEPGNNLIISSDGLLNKHIYWKPNFKENKELNEEEVVEKSKNLLIQSIKLTTRSDVPIAFTLSGGIDSASLVSIAAKKLNLKFKTYSIIDDDKRYDERKNINNILNDVQCENRQVKIKSENSFDNLIQLICYHEKPLASIAQLNHFNLMKEIKKDNIKVCLNGTMADELYAGYLDHHLQYFSSIKNKEYKKREIKFWKEKVLKTIRNPIFRNHDLYAQNHKTRSHIFDNHELLKSYLVKKNSFKFREKKFTNNLLRNRMLNEIFYENTPQILHDEDLNSMFNSIENRSPFIDRKLFDFLFSVNTKFLIKNGFKKYILRKSMDGILDNKVRWNYEKMGFNSSIESIYNFKNKTIKEFLFDKKSNIYEFIDYKKFQKLFLDKKFPNHLSKFIFNVIGCKIFLENVDK